MTAAALIGLGIVVASAAGGMQDWFDGEASDDGVIVRGVEKSYEGGLTTEVSDPVAGPEQPEIEYCEPIAYMVGNYRVGARTCGGEVAATGIAPVFDDPEDDTSEDEVEELIALSREDVQSLLVDAGGLEVQPDRSWVLVNTETIAFTGAEQQLLTTTVLDAPIEVRVTPVQFSWDFGDGSPPLTTSDPGAPWPDHTVAHAYDAAQEASISVQTQWDAVFRIEGTATWFPVAGTVVTLETSDSFDVVTATPRLVAGGS